VFLIAGGEWGTNNMRNKFLGTGEPGYRPIRKFLVILNGLKFSVLHDYSVAYKVVLSIITMVTSYYFKQWIALMAILIVTGLMTITITTTMDIKRTNTINANHC
jgi:hypothetical protein